MAELIYGDGESIELGTGPVTVGTGPGCTLAMKRESGDPEADALAAAVAAAKAAVAAAGGAAAGILAPSQVATVPTCRFFVIQWHDPGHILKDLSGCGAVKVNGKVTLIHRLVDHDLIEADGDEFEYQNGNMLPGSWEILEKKKGVRSIRWLLPIVAFVALLVVLFIQWMNYGQKKYDEMQVSKKQQKTISKEKAKEIIEDISKTKEERLAEMSPDDLRRIREDFLMDENATEEEKEANLQALASLFGAENISELLEGGNEEDILAMLNGDPDGRLKYKRGMSEKELEEEDNMIEEMFRHSGEPDEPSGSRTTDGATGGGGANGGATLEAEPVKEAPRTEEEIMLAEMFRHREELKNRGAGRGAGREQNFDWLTTKDRQLMDEAAANLKTLDAEIRFSINNVPAIQAAALRLHQKDAVLGYMETGHRDEKWDVDVLAAIQLDVRTRTVSLAAIHPAVRDRLVEFTGNALKAGCRDPHLLLIRENLVKKSSKIDLPFQGAGTPLENAAMMIDGLARYGGAPLMRARIYLFAVKAVLEEVKKEGEGSLKGVPLDLWMTLPAPVVGNWERWIDRGLEDVVAAAPDLRSANMRDAYAEVLDEIFRVYSQALGDPETVREAMKAGLLHRDGGAEVLASLEGVFEQFVLQR